MTTDHEDFGEWYWRQVDLAWVGAKPQMETELANISRRDAQRVPAYIFPADRGGETAQ